MVETVMLKFKGAYRLKSVSGLCSANGAESNCNLFLGRMFR